MEKTNNKEDKLKNLSVLLGLAVSQKQAQVKAQEHKSPPNCPDEEMIAAYFDNDLSLEEDKKILSSLNHCPESYSLWLSLLETLEYTEQKHQTSENKNFIATLAETAENWFKKHQMSLTGAMATGFLFLFVINFSYTPFAQLPIDKQIVKIWQDSELLDLAYVDVSQFTPQGLAKSTISIMPFPEKIAFSSGFKQGLINMSAVSQQVKSDSKTLDFLNSLPDEPLHCENQLCEKETQLNMQLGIWSSFVLQECQQQQSTQGNYWNKQRIVIKHFLQEYQNLNVSFGKKLKHSNSLIKKVNKIEHSLNTLILGKSANRYSKQIIVCKNIKQLALSSIQAL